MMKRRAYDNWPIANIWLRLAAQIIDQIIVISGSAMGLAFIYPQKMANTQWWILLFFLWPLISLCLSCIFIYFTHTTPGKKAFGLKIRSAKPHQPLNVWQVLSRQSLWWLSVLSFGVGWATMLTRSDRRAWHDLVSETFVAAEAKGALTRPTTLLQKTLGHSWAVTVSLTFFCFLSAVILFEFQKFNQIEAEANLITSQIPLPTLDEASWLLFTDQFEKAPVKFSNLEEERLAEQIRLFLKAQNLAKQDRFDFYKNKMQQNEDYLCRQTQANSATCHSAQVISTVLSGVQSQTASLEGVYPSLRVLEKTEQAKSFQEKTQILQAELSLLDPTSIGFIAIKTHLIRIHSQKGEFDKASAYTSNTIFPSEAQNQIQDLVTNRYYEYSCEALGFSKCDVSSFSFCQYNKFWSQWSSGCKKKKFDEDDPNAEKLGFLWKQLSQSKLSEAFWSEQKSGFGNLNIEPMEKQIFSAIDFAINLESTNPANVVEKSKLISLDNPLWGWAQTRALKEYGNQWLSLINKTEQSQAAQYAIGRTERPDRIVASVKKPKKKKKRN